MERSIMDSRPTQQKFDFSIVSAELTIEAMRDSGYKDTDHALAELIDNSVEAKADLVEIIAVERLSDPQKPYARPQVSEIAVVDNGEGMNSTTLRRALKFGDGTRRLNRQKGGIGRFGVGLPQSSISQCLRVDIWTWQNGADNAYHCYLDLDEIKSTGQQEVPEPVFSSVPERWKEVATTTSETAGTLVVWSKLDRVQWRGGAKTIERTADLCGRVYRKFITDREKPVMIKLLLASDKDSYLAIDQEKECFPNDPLYLMSPSSTPEPFQDKPMFELFNEKTWSIPIGNIQGEIHVRCTMARPDAINEKKSKIPWPKSYSKAGDAPWGKHAARNKGVSIVRARRELEMSTAWVNNYEPEERWWSVEVEFDPILDEIFGVVNNKQHAHTFVKGAGFDWKDWSNPEETFGEFSERLKETSDPMANLIEVWIWIDKQIGQMRSERRTIMRGTGGSQTRHPQTGEEVEDVATKIINEQMQRGETGDSDKAPETNEEEKIQKIVESTKQVRVKDKTAYEWAEETVRGGRRVLMKAVTLGHQDAFFDVESVNDVLEIWLNDQHPVHKHLIQVLAAEIEDQSSEELVERIRKAEFTLKMLLIAWARHEDKVPTEIKERLEDIRMDWGREARKFLKVIES